MAPDADHPTRTLARTLTRTLWGDLRLDVVACEFAAVACEGSIIGDIFSLCFRGVCMAYISTRAGAAENVFLGATRRIIQRRPFHQGGGVSDTVSSPKRHSNSYKTEHRGR